MSEEPDKLKIVSVMSVPMCGWNPHWGCHSAALAPMGLADQIIAFGAWWDHGISNAFEDVIEGGADWILAIDYDSMFTADHVSALFKRFGENPHIDALAANQPRRGSEETPLLTMGPDARTVEFTHEAVQVTTAHFGLTLFRAESIAKMPRPWFMHIPDGNGSYRTRNRVDPDMFFWKEWAAAGNTLYVDPHVNIGHLQPMVTEMYRADDGYMRTRHVHFMEWRKRANRVTTDRPESEAA